MPDAIDHAFPGAVPAAVYLDRVQAALEPHDFALERTFAAVSLCRDELNHQLSTDIAARWNLPFNLGGLGALPSLGRTGWAACLSHVPGRGGRGHLLVFAFPHVGIGPDGTLGESLRRHQDHATPTCGALMSLLPQLLQPDPGPGVSPTGSAEEERTLHLADAEAIRLRKLVAAELAEPPQGIAALTRATERAVNREIWVELDALAPWEAMDVAVFTGIQINLPDESDHVLGIDARVRTGPTAVEHSLEV
jgi:hypothetical protein